MLYPFTMKPLQLKSCIQTDIRKSSVKPHRLNTLNPKVTGGRPPGCTYIAAGTVIPSHPKTLTNSLFATAAVASSNAFRAASVSVKIWCRW
jgi:hypothetical protein